MLRSLLWNIRAFVVNVLLRLTRGARPYRFLRLSLHGAIDEDPARPGLRRLLRGSRPSLIELIEILDLAARDKKLEGVLLEIGPLAAGRAQIESLVEALAAVRRAGKRVTAFFESAGSGEYLLAACGADRVVLHPTGTLNWMGMGAEVTMLGPALERFGVSVDLEPVGRYKSAVETFTRATLSDDARNALASLIDDLFTQSCDAIAKARGASREHIEKLVDQGPFLAQEALAHRLVDRLAFQDEVVTELVGGEEPKMLAKLVSPRRYLRLRRRDYRRLRDGGPVPVAWIPVLGGIRSGDSGSGLGAESGTTSTAAVHALRRARRAKEIRAVLLRVDSPGGSALASDVIWREVARTREVKPVIVSMGDYAASGGYYVATPATAVMASAGTITGSIGVFGGKFSIGALYRRVGIHKDGHTRGAHATMFTESRRFTRSERKKLRQHLEDAYRVFLERVADGRHSTVEKVATHAEGRVWTGRQALERGLVDGNGGLVAALELLRSKAGITAKQEIELVSMYHPRGLIPRLIERFAESSLARSPIPEAWLSIARSMRSGEALALLPFELRIR